MSSTKDSPMASSDVLKTGCARAHSHLRPLVLLQGEVSDENVGRVSRLLEDSHPPCACSTSLRPRRRSNCGENRDQCSSYEGVLRLSWIGKHSDSSPACVLHVLQPGLSSTEAAAQAERSASLAQSFGARTVILVLAQAHGPEEAYESARLAGIVDLPGIFSVRAAKLADGSSAELDEEEEHWRIGAADAAAAAEQYCFGKGAHAAKKYSSYASQPHLQCRGALKAGVWAERRNDPQSALRNLQQARRIASLGLGPNATFSSVSRFQEREVASFAASKAIDLALADGSAAADAIAATHLRELPVPSLETLPNCADAGRAEEHLRMHDALRPSHFQAPQHLRSAALPASRLVRRLATPSLSAQLQGNQSSESFLYESDYVGCLVCNDRGSACNETSSSDDPSGNVSSEAVQSWVSNRLLARLEHFRRYSPTCNVREYSWLSGCEALLRCAVSLCGGIRAQTSLRVALSIERARCGRVNECIDEAVLQRLRDECAHSLRTSLLAAFTATAQRSLANAMNSATIAQRELELAGAMIKAPGISTLAFDSLDVMSNAREIASRALFQRLHPNAQWSSQEHASSVMYLAQGCPLDARVGMEMVRSKRKQCDTLIIYLGLWSELPTGVILQGCTFVTLSEVITSLPLLTLYKPQQQVTVRPREWQVTAFSVPHSALTRPSLHVEAAPHVGIVLSSGGTLSVSCSGESTSLGDTSRCDASSSPPDFLMGKACISSMFKAGLSNPSLLQSGHMELPEPDEGATVSISAAERALTNEPVLISVHAEGDETTSSRLAVRIDANSGAHIMHGSAQKPQWKKCVATPVKAAADPDGARDWRDYSGSNMDDADGALVCNLHTKSNVAHCCKAHIGDLQAFVRWPEGVIGGATVEATLLADHDAIARSSWWVNVIEPFNSIALLRRIGTWNSESILHVQLRNISGVSLKIVGVSERCSFVSNNKLAPNGHTEITIEPECAASLILRDNYIGNLEAIGVLWQRTDQVGLSTSHSANEVAVEHRIPIENAGEPRSPHGSPSSDGTFETTISLHLVARESVCIGVPFLLEIELRSQPDELTHPVGKSVQEHTEGRVLTVSLGSFGAFLAAGPQRLKLQLPNRSLRRFKTTLVPTRAGQHRLPNVIATEDATGYEHHSHGQDEIFVHVA